MPQNCHSEERSDEESGGTVDKRAVDSQCRPRFFASLKAQVSFEAKPRRWIKTLKRIRYFRIPRHLALGNASLAVSTAILALTLLAAAACASSVTPPPEEVLEKATPIPTIRVEINPGAETTVPGPTPAAGAATGPAVIHVGVVESIGEDELVLSTIGGSVTLILGAQTEVQAFRVATLQDLKVGQRVTVMGIATGEGFTTSSVLVTMEGTSLFEDLGEVPVGRGRLAYIGNIASIGDGAIELATNLEPRTAAVSADGTPLQMAPAIAGGDTAAIPTVAEFDPARQAGEYQGVVFGVAPGSRGPIHRAGAVGAATLAQ